MENLGYLQAKLESLSSALEKHMEDEGAFKEKIISSLEKLQNEMSLAKHFLLFIRLLGYTIALLIALKFGDVKTLWHDFITGG
jgi:hypothetical protein